MREIIIISGVFCCVRWYRGYIGWSRRDIIISGVVFVCEMV